MPMSISLGASSAGYGTISSDERYSDEDLMAHSREQLTMDMSKSDNSMFKRPRGCYVTQSKAVILAVLFVGALVVVGYGSYHYASKNLGSQSDGASGNSGDESDSTKSKVKDVRLPETVKPLYYKIDLIPYVEEAKNFSIDGKVWIDIECRQSTDKITIHKKNITIMESSVEVYEVAQAQLPVSQARQPDKLLIVVKHDYDEPREFYNFTLSRSLEKGKIYRIYIQYEAILADSLGGFYRSSYKDKSTGEKRYLGTTQFQATDARKAFPCFDEPALKARFEVSLARRTNMTSISNMNLNRTEPVAGMEGWEWDHYNVSVPMSTYLVAFVVSDFDHKMADRNLSRPEFRVWARKDAISQVEYAKDIGPRILTYYEEYFDIEFPLPKQDMIALPDFGAGAMENWGLITYRETAMLYEPNVSSDTSKQRIATVVAHELAHMWYGNLVTMSWWSDLWLNEGFASYVEYIGVNHVHPDWKVLEQFVGNELQYVFSLDSLDSSHPIYIPVEHPDDISGIFDGISYSKGASIIRMMNHFLTESTFRSGLTNYLRKWMFNSTIQDDLWDSLTEVAHANKTLDRSVGVKEIMDTWTLQKGFPVIDVKRNYSSKQAEFTQTKFQLIKNETLRDTEYAKYRWWVPISYATNSFNEDFSKTQPEFWMKDIEKSITEEVQGDAEDWLIVNVQETGFYRVNYDERNWELIANQLKSNYSAIHTVNRAQLVDDSLNLARASLISYDLAFNITQYLRGEKEYLPWNSFFSAFQFIAVMLSKSPSYGIFKSYMRDLLSMEYDRLGYQQLEEDSLLIRLHRVNVLNWACKMDHEECISAAQKSFSQWMNESDSTNQNPIPTNLRRLTYCMAIKNGGEQEWEFLWNMYKSSNVASEKATILSALACSKEAWILNRYLTWAISPDSEIRKQDAAIVISAVASSDMGNYIAFNFIRDKWPELKKTLDEGLSSLGRIVKSVARRLNSPFELLEIEKFREMYKNDLGSAKRSVDQAIESATIQLQWMEENYKSIASWLSQTVKGSNKATDEL